MERRKEREEKKIEQGIRHTKTNDEKKWQKQRITDKERRKDK